MARKKGTLNISSNIEPNAAAPLDARTVVATMEELASAETFPFPYAGLTVFVRAENESYVFTGGDITDTANWKRVGISEELEAELKANTAAIETLNGAGEGSVTKAVADGIAEVVASAPEDFDTLKEIADYIEADKTGAAQMNNAISENARNISQAQTDIAANAADITQAKQDISDLDEKVQDAEYDDTAITERITDVENLLGGHSVGTSVPANALFTDTVYDDSAMQSSIRTIETALSNISQGATRDIDALEGRVSANETAIDTLNGTGEGSVKKAVADGIAEVVASAPEDLDTLKEIADYIAADKTKATEIETAISDNARDITAAKDNIEQHTRDIAAAQSSIRTVQTALGNHTVQKDVPADALFTDTVYDDTALANRMQAAEQDIETLKVSGYDDTEIKRRMQAAEGDITSLSGRVDDVETALDGHTLGKDVPADAIFTDTVYDDTTISGRVEAVESALDGHTVRKSVPADAVFTDTVYDDAVLQTAVQGIRTDLGNYYKKSETFSKSEIQEMIATINALKIIAVTELPTSDIDESAIYIVKDSDEVGNLYSEYIHVDGKWEQFGTAKFNMDGYVTTEALNTALASYATTQSVNEALAPYATTQAMNTALAGKADKSEIPDTANFVTESALTTRLGDYATTSAMNTELAKKANTEDIPEAYVLPEADDETLGGVKLAAGWTKDADGRLEVPQTAAGGGAIPAYIVGDTMTKGWLSLTDGGTALTPVDKQEYVILTSGDWLRKHVMWFEGLKVYRLTGKVGVLDEKQRDILQDRSEYKQNLVGTGYNTEGGMIYKWGSGSYTANNITLKTKGTIGFKFTYDLKGSETISVKVGSIALEDIPKKTSGTFNKSFDVKAEYNGLNPVISLNGSYGAGIYDQGAVVDIEITYIIEDIYNDYETDDILDITEEEIDAIWMKHNGSVRFVDSVMSILSRVGYRNKFLGNEFTDAQKAAIAAGDFSDLWNGDYWIINGIYWRIWDNTGWYMNRGDTPFTKSHLVIMPDECLVKNKGINTSDTTAGGYNGTRYRSTDRATCKQAFVNAFGAEHIATFRGLHTNAIVNGHASGWGWVDADVELPNELSIYGSTVWGDGYGTGFNTGPFSTQLALARINQQSIIAAKPDGTKEHWWLRDVVSASMFAHVGNENAAARGFASSTVVGFRPLALLI